MFQPNLTRRDFFRQTLALAAASGLSPGLFFAGEAEAEEASRSNNNKEIETFLWKGTNFRVAEVRWSTKP